MQPTVLSAPSIIKSIKTAKLIIVTNDMHINYAKCFNNNNQIYRQKVLNKCQMQIIATQNGFIQHELNLRSKVSSKPHLSSWDCFESSDVFSKCSDWSVIDPWQIGKLMKIVNFRHSIRRLVRNILLSIKPKLCQSNFNWKTFLISIFRSPGLDLKQLIIISWN